MAAKKRSIYADTDGALHRLCRQAEDEHARQTRKRGVQEAELKRRNHLLGTVGVGLALAALLGIIALVVWTFAAAGTGP